MHILYVCSSPIKQFVFIIYYYYYCNYFIIILYAYFILLEDQLDEYYEMRQMTRYLSFGIHYHCIDEISHKLENVHYTHIYTLIHLNSSHVIIYYDRQISVCKNIMWPSKICFSFFFRPLNCKRPISERRAYTTSSALQNDLNIFNRVPVVAPTTKHGYSKKLLYALHKNQPPTHEFTRRIIGCGKAICGRWNINTRIIGTIIIWPRTT